MSIIILNQTFLVVLLSKFKAPPGIDVCQQGRIITGKGFIIDLRSIDLPAVFICHDWMDCENIDVFFGHIFIYGLG